MRRFLACTLALLLMVASGLAAEPRRTNANLPYRFPQVDAFGNVWMLYNGGRLMQQGNMPFCSDSASLAINGQGIQSPNQNIVLEEGEAILENMRTGQFMVTRRFLQSEDGAMRIVDIIRNLRGQEVVANVLISFNVNMGVQNSRQLTDPRKNEKTLGTVITDTQGRSLLSVFAGRSAKVTPTINAPQNNSLVQATFEVKVPANKEVAIVHFHQTLATPDQADKVFAALREPKALSSLSPDLRRVVANFVLSSGAWDDMEILRGTTTDVLELANGDQLRGDLLNSNWEVQTSFGNVQIPPDEVIGLIVAGGLSPRQLLITRDGEIIGGKLSTPTVDLQISSGQKISVPMDQVARFGKRISANESTSASNKPIVHLRTGDRLAVGLPAEPIKIVTRFGTLVLPADSIASIDLQPEQSPVHVISLTDGSRFSGLMLADATQFQLLRGGNLQVPTALLRKLTFASDAEAEPVSSMRLTGEDTLAAGLPEKLPLITSYGEVAINGAEVKRITRVKESAEDIQVQLWDDSTITGRLAQPYLECSLGGKALARVPVAAIEQYSSSAPQPAAGIVERIRKLVVELNADDWKQRERAEAELLNLGSVIVPTLNQLRPGQPPEAQQRIDSIVRRLTNPSQPAPAVRPAIAPRVLE